MIVEIAIIVSILLYWKFIYYKYHHTPYSAISTLILGASMVIYGLYGFFITKDVNFENIRILYYIVLVYLIIEAIILFGIIKRRHIYEKEDATLHWIEKYLGYYSKHIAMIIAFPAMFFMLLGTYKLFGNAHIYLWIMIFIAWLRSGIKLLKRDLKNNNQNGKKGKSSNN